MFRFKFFQKRQKASMKRKAVMIPWLVDTKISMVPGGPTSIPPKCKPWMYYNINGFGRVDLKHLIPNIPEYRSHTAFTFEAELMQGSCIALRNFLVKLIEESDLIMYMPMQTEKTYHTTLLSVKGDCREQVTLWPRRDDDSFTTEEESWMQLLRDGEDVFLTMEHRHIGFSTPVLIASSKKLCDEDDGSFRLYKSGYPP